MSKPIFFTDKGERIMKIIYDLEKEGISDQDVVDCLIQYGTKPSKNAEEIRLIPKEKKK